MLGYDSAKSDQTLVYVLTLGVVEAYRSLGIGRNFTLYFCWSPLYNNNWQSNSCLICSCFSDSGGHKICFKYSYMPSCLLACNLLQQPCNQFVQENVFQVCEKVARILSNQWPTLWFVLILVLCKWGTVSLLAIVSTKYLSIFIPLFVQTGLTYYALNESCYRWCRSFYPITLNWEPQKGWTWTDKGLCILCWYIHVLTWLWKYFISLL